MRFWNDIIDPCSPVLYPIMIGALVFGQGCSSSEETGATRGADRSEQVGPIVAELPETTMTPEQGDTMEPGLGGGQVADPTLRRGRDTVTASTQRIARSSTQRQPLQKPPDAMYTVQVGAYKRASNALSMQKMLKSEHGEHPVFNMFAPTEGLYRVTIGKFETLVEAANYRKMLLKQHPKRFGECWVTYIERSR